MITIKRINALCGVLALFMGTLFFAPATADVPPNIIFILADDLGWHELGCYGNTYNETPHLDALASGGIRFTNAYAAAPVCSPYRASLMTGQYPARIGIHKWLDKSDFDKNLPRQYTTIAETLKSAGYATGIIGKWHLSCYADDGDPDPIEPAEQGFDEHLAGATTYIGNGDYWHPYWIMPALPKAPLVLDPAYPNEEFLVDRCNYEAVHFIERHKDEPFFLYLSHYAVHTKLDGKPNLVSHFEAKPNSGTGVWAPVNNPHLAAQLSTIDEGVGQIVAKLQAYNLLKNTLLVFMGDNGGDGNVTDNGPLRGAKGNLYEGGIRVPLIMSWPGHLASGSVCNEPVVSCDFFPTFSQLAGTALPGFQPMDGVSLTSLFQHPQNTLNRESICWYYPHNQQSAIRQGEWKLIEHLDTGTIELYDLSKDLSEASDQKYQNPQTAMKLLRDLKKWRTGIPRFYELDNNGSIGSEELIRLSDNWLN